MEDLKLLHLGCGGLYYEGFINCDKTDTTRHDEKYQVDKLFNLKDSWPFEDESIDGIVSMHVLQQLYWRDLIPALVEAHRVLKTNGVMRIGVPAIENGKPLDYLLGWNNVNLFSVELLYHVLKEVGFTVIGTKYQQSINPKLSAIDTRPDQTIFLEVVK